MAKLTLSSKTTDFTTWLQPPIRMENNQNYEAAFLSIQTYNSLPNITETNNKFTYSSDKGKTWSVLTLPKGAYEFHEITAHIQREMRANGHYDVVNDKHYIDIDYYKPTFKTLLDISNEDYMIDFGVPTSIGPTLGFASEKLSHGIHQSPNIIDIEKVNSILVHCDIVLGSYVNSRSSNVIHSFTQKVGPGYKIIERASPELIFLPVVGRPDIQSIRLWLTDQDNNPIDLMGERITIDILIRVKK